MANSKAVKDKAPPGKRGHADNRKKCNGKYVSAFNLHELSDRCPGGHKRASRSAVARGFYKWASPTARKKGLILGY